MKVANSFYLSVSMGTVLALTPCSLELLEWLDPNGFVIVVDDAERSGEVLLRNRIAQKLQAKGISFSRGELAANKRQSIFASGRFSHAAFY
jgi:hypothetical protein